MAQYTKFEMIWKDIFLVVTLFILFTKDYGYVWKLQTVPARQWSSHQIWVLLLLCGLVMFNDPFFSLQVCPPLICVLAPPRLSTLFFFRFLRGLRCSSRTFTSL